MRTAALRLLRTLAANSADVATRLADAAPTSALLALLRLSTGLLADATDGGGDGDSGGRERTVPPQPGVVKVNLDLWRLLAVTPAAATQLSAHGVMRPLCALLVRVSGLRVLHAELRAQATEVHAALTGGDLGLLELPPTQRPPGGAELRVPDDDVSPFDAAATALRQKLSAIGTTGTELVLGGRRGKMHV